MGVDLDAFRWLLTDDGQALLARAEEYAGDDPLAAQTRLRAAATPEQAAAALTQATLRRRAEPKFGELAPRLYFTPDGLEQATRPAVARHRVARLQAFAASTLVDLGCGIGGDLMASAEVGIICAGVDLDPVRVAVAEANLAALGLPGAVMVADAVGVDTSPFSVAFADPARRSARGRSFSVDDWTPPWSFVEGLLRRDSCVKVAPGIPHDLVPADVEAEWVSDHGEVKEAALWSGSLATTAVAAGVGGGLVDPHIAYVTSDRAFRSPFARGYRVVEELPYREKQLKAALRERGVGRLTIKKRGVDVVPEVLRKRLSLSGDAEATLVMTRVAGSGTALLVQPL